MRERAREGEREGDGECDGEEEEEKSASQIRRKESRFTVESKAFEIVVEERRGKIQGRIVEKKGGASSWGEEETRWGREWKEQGRVYSMTRGTNRAGGFIQLGVSDIEGKRFCIFVPRENQKGKVVEKVAMGRSYATMVGKSLSVASWRDGSGGKDDMEKLGQVWAKSWDLKGNLGLAKLNKRKALLEFENLEEARRVISSGSCVLEGTQVRLEHWSPRSGCWAEGEERNEAWVRIVGLPISLWSPEILRRVGDACGGFITVDEHTKSMGDLQWARILVKLRWEADRACWKLKGRKRVTPVSLWWECWPVVRRKCRNEADRHSREVRGEEVSRAGQRVRKDWVSGRLETLQPSDEVTDVQGVGSGQVEISPDLSLTTRTWVSSGPSYDREDVGCYSKGPAPPIAQLPNKGLFCSKACTQQPDQGGKIREGPKSPIVQEVTGLLLKYSAPSYPPEAETFVARETEDTRKLQGVIRLTKTDRALEEESMRDLDEEGRADNSMWLTVYEACNERIKECKELVVIKCSSDKGREMGGVGDIDDAQVERSEPEGKWEESGLARFSQFLGFPTEGLEKEILTFLTKIRKRREKIHSKELLEKSKFERELKRLECSINYEGGVKQKGSETKLHCMTDSIARSIGFGRFLGWKAVNAEGASGGIFICWDRRSLDMLDWEEGQFTLSCRFRNVENGTVWVFTGVYGPFSKVERDALWEEFGAIRGLWEDPWFLVSPSWIDQFSGINQCRLPRPVSDHFPIIWWQGIDVRGSASYKLATKMKEIKQKLKVWNREVFGKLECNKSAALQQVEFWDREENDRILTMEETELKKEAKRKMGDYGGNSLETAF
ncbi:hypothetical protein CK203_091735 [Vitis vinifera]|uniref:DUF4283 domain-containing protein n=1 Tax=Vitis vinifera TaxID=29760 RepID=A0A438EJD8_VITVI|nr:hypothetical protein CK203_091735 [Vitis vinifera]